MITSSHRKCPSCKLLFGFQNTPKILKNCQHTLCINCLKTQQCCPIDLLDINLYKWGLKSFLTNTKILQQIQNEGKINIQQSRGQRFSFSKKMRTNESSNLYEIKNESKWQICRIHTQKANYICKKECVFICSLCIQSGNHKDHEFLSYQQLVKKMTNYIDSAYKIYEELKIKFQKLSKIKINNLIELQINRKKQKQGYQIRNYFQELIQKIRRQQRQSLQRLDRIAKQSIQQLKQSIQMNQYYTKKQVWVKQIHRLTQIMEGVYEKRQFSQALKYLDDKRQRNSVIERGQGLIMQFQNMNQKIISRVEEKVDLLNCQFNKRLMEFMNSICQFNSGVNKLEQIKLQKRKVKKLRISKSYQLVINQYIKNMKQQSLLSVFLQRQQYINQPKNQQQIFQEQQDNLLDNTESQNHQKYNNQQQNSSYQSQNNVQTITKNQITFEQNYQSISIDNQKEQFTPILKKQQNSILQQSTIINLKNIHFNYQPLLNALSQDITTDSKPILQSITINRQKNITNARSIRNNYSKSKSNSQQYKSNLSYQNQSIDMYKYNINANQTIPQLSQTLPYSQNHTFIITETNLLNTDRTLLNGNNNLQNQNNTLLFTQTTLLNTSRSKFNTQRSKYNKDQTFYIKDIKERRGQSKERSPLKSLINSSSYINISQYNKFKKLNIQQKYIPVWQNAIQDKSQLIDFTGAQLGDSTVLHLCQYLSQSTKIRSLKLIRNKLTDQIIYQLLQCITQSNISSLNLSQNNLTQKVIDILQNKQLGNLKSITLSLNKIVYRKVKDKIQIFRERGITLTV